MQPNVYMPQGIASLCTQPNLTEPKITKKSQIVPQSWLVKPNVYMPQGIASMCTQPDLAEAKITHTKNI